jgi:hypothetical protein
MQVRRIATDIIADRKSSLTARVGQAPRHLPH